jgi:hypothetical protein
MHCSLLELHWTTFVCSITEVHRTSIENKKKCLGETIYIMLLANIQSCNTTMQYWVGAGPGVVHGYSLNTQIFSDL